MTSEPTSTPAVSEPVSVAMEPQQVAEALSAEAPDVGGGEAKDSGELGTRGVGMPL